MTKFIKTGSGDFDGSQEFEVVLDTTPQLGGDLDVNDNDIVGKPAGATDNGGDVNVTAADGGATSGDGGDVNVTAGAGDAGGDINLTGGESDSGAGGQIFIRPGKGDGSAPTIPAPTGNVDPTEFWFVDTQATPGYVGLKAPADVSAGSTGDGNNTVWTLPEGDGTSGQVWQTNGSGVLSWVTVASSGHTHATDDLTDVANSTPADKHVLIYDGVTDNRYENRLLVEADISDLQSYLTAEVNDLSAAVTWANIPDANVPETAVTQHEAALSIAHTQITGESWLENVVEDTTPQLGGNLDTDDNRITNAAGANIRFDKDLSLIEDSTLAQYAAIAYSNTADASGRLALGHYGGTEASIASLSAGNRLGDINFLGRYDTTSIASVNIEARIPSGGTVSNSSCPGEMVISTIPDGSTTLTERFIVEADGTLKSLNTSYETLVTADDDIPNKKYVDDAVSGAGGLSNVVEDTTPQLGGQLDVNGQALGDGTLELLSFSETASAVNHVEITNAATGSGPTVRAAGDDTNVDLNLEGKGTGKVKLTDAEMPLEMNNQTGTTYGPVRADAEKTITMNNASANTVTIPANSSVAYPIGTKLNFMQLGAGQTTIAITTDTLSVESSLTLKLKGQYAVATALKITSTQWVLFGNLEAA